MTAGQHSVTIRTVGRDLEISNGLVLIRLVLCDGGYAQEFWAANSRGQYQLLLSSIHKNLIPSSEHRALTSPMISGDREHLFAVCRESLRMVYSDVQILRCDDTSACVRMTGSAQGHSLKSDVTVEAGNSMVRVEVEDKLPGGVLGPVLEYLMSSYAFLPDGRTFAASEEPDFTWAPNIRPTNDAIIGDSAFHSPAVIVQHGRLAAALIPDSSETDRARPMPMALDLDLTNGLLFAPLLSYGYCGYERTDQGKYFRHDITMSRRLPTSIIRYGYSIMLSATAKRGSLYKDVARFLWSKHSEPGPVVYAKSRILSPESLISADSHAACGLYAEGIRTGNRELIERAREIRDAILSSPQNSGLFPTRFDPAREQGCCVNADNGFYSTVECSTQLYWLLKLHALFEPDARIVSFARRYADHLIESKLRSGAIPSWYTEDLIPISALRSSAQTAASALFLAELAKVTELKMYLRAAEQSAKFILNEIVPKRLFVDHTCLSSDGMLSLECADPHTGMRTMSAQAMLWIAQLCAQLYSLTGTHPYLEDGLDVMDLLCLSQAMTDKPWDSSTSRFGLCSRGNIGAQLDAELSAEFARCAMYYGALSGEREYFERGVAALNAAMSVDQTAESHARIAADAAVAQSQFGSIYAHMSAKWAIETDGFRVTNIDFGKGSISLDISASSTSIREGRIVFGGLKGSSYKVIINGEAGTFTRADLESGISIPVFPPPDQGALFQVS